MGKKNRHYQRSNGRFEGRVRPHSRYELKHDQFTLDSFKASLLLSDVELYITRFSISFSLSLSLSPSL